MKSIITLCFFAFLLNPFLSTTDALGTELRPILDGANTNLPKKFRTTSGPLKDPSYPVVEGLKQLSISGSGQYYEQNLLTSLSIIQEIEPDYSIVIVDLREESHGFINGIPISWTNGQTNDANTCKNLEEIELDELRRLEDLKKQGTITISSKSNTGEETIAIESVCTERELVESLGLGYVRMPITDHLRPSDEFVDHFVNFIQSKPQNTWMHFHCKGGVGRTTMILIMHDMMQNANIINVDDFFERHNLLGGKDLRTLDPSSFKYEVSIERLAFIKEFYIYCREVPDFSVSWSDWLASKK